MRPIPKTAWLLSILSGVLQVLAFPKFGISALAWIALVPLIYALLRSPEITVFAPGDTDDPYSLRPAQGFWIGYLCGIVWYAGSCYWIYNTMRHYGGLSSVVSALMLLLFSCYLGLYHGLFAALLVRVSQGRVFRGIRALLLVPFLWVAVELARGRITGFPWELLGNAVVGNIPLTRIAPITGVHGLSFIIAGVNVMFAAMLLVPRKRWKWAIAAFASAGLLHAGTLIKYPVMPYTHRAVLVQSNVPILANGAWSPEFYDQTISSLVDLSRRAATTDILLPPRLIIWPESPAPFYLNDPKFRRWISTLASDRDAFIIAGSIGIKQLSAQQSEVYNSAALVGPSGAFLSRYDKIHLVPFGEYVPFQSLLFFAEKLTREVSTFSRGSERNVLSLSGTGHNSGASEIGGRIAPEYKAGVFICYESVFGDEVRQFAANGAQVLINISNDGWYGESSAPLQLLNMSRMRAIENNRWLLRATNTGVTASIDPYGRVVARTDRNIRTTLDAPYAFVPEPTFYTRHGDWLAYTCAIISLVAVFVRFNFRAGFITTR